MTTAAMVLWMACASSFAIYWGCIRNFEATLKKEDFRLWESLVLRQVNALRVVRRAVFFTFVFNGDYDCLNNVRIARATTWTVISGVIFGLSGAAVYWYYSLYLPYNK